MALYSKLRAFHSVAKNNSFSAAAVELGVGQPIISRHVGELERVFDVQLFVRRGRNLSITEEGLYLFSLTKDFFADEALAIEYLSNIKEHDYHLDIRCLLGMMDGCGQSISSISQSPERLGPSQLWPRILP